MRNRNKYHVAPKPERTYKGRVFASKAEMQYCQLLEAYQNAGIIILFLFQPTIELGIPENKYRPDFHVMTRDGDYYVDVKGVETAAFLKNKKLWKKYGLKPLHIIKKHGSKFSTVQIIIPCKQ